MLNSYDVVRPAWMDWLNETRPALQEVYYDLFFSGAQELAEVMNEEQKKICSAQNYLQYDLMFGEGCSAQELYGISAAKE